MSESIKQFYIARDPDGLGVMFENEPTFDRDWRADGACTVLNEADLKLFSGKNLKPGKDVMKVNIDINSHAFFPHRKKFGIS